MMRETERVGASKQARGIGGRRFAAAHRLRKKIVIPRRLTLPASCDTRRPSDHDCAGTLCAP